MTRLAAIILIVLLSLSANESFAYTGKEGNLAIILGPTIYKTNFGGANPDYNNNYGSNLALIAVGDLSDNGGVELGIFLLEKTFLRGDNGYFLAQEAEMLHITMGWRAYFSKMFSSSITFFSAYPMGTPSTVYSNIPSSVFVNTSASDKVEYGFDFAAQAEVANWGKVAVITDLRYSLSLTPKEEEHADHYGAMIGIRYLPLEK